MKSAISFILGICITCFSMWFLSRVLISYHQLEFNDGIFIGLFGGIPIKIIRVILKTKLDEK